MSQRDHKNRKAKPPPSAKKPVDPKQVFRLAEAFALAEALFSNYTWKTKNPGRRGVSHADAIPFAPSETLRGLMLELYLKCLLFMDKKTPGNVHRADLLFNSLPAPTQTRVLHFWRLWLSDHPQDFRAEPDFGRIIHAASDAFTYFRYMYEGEPADQEREWWTRPLVEVVRQVILEREPTWHEDPRVPKEFLGG